MNPGELCLLPNVETIRVSCWATYPDGNGNWSSLKRNLRVVYDNLLVSLPLKHKSNITKVVINWRTVDFLNRGLNDFYPPPWPPTHVLQILVFIAHNEMHDARGQG